MTNQLWNMQECRAKIELNKKQNKTENTGIFTSTGKSKINTKELHSFLRNHQKYHKTTPKHSSLLARYLTDINFMGATSSTFTSTHEMYF